MVPSEIDEPVPMAVDEKTYPPARIFSVKEAKFEKYITPQLDGREKALAQPAGKVAIVIDNGKLQARF
jgi:actin-related protein 5